MNILVLGAGNLVRTDNGYPAFLNEIDDGATVLERIYESVRSLSYERLVFAFHQADVRRYRLDSVVRCLEPRAEVIEVAGATKGAACTALMAVDKLQPEQELLLISANEIVEVDLEGVLQRFRQQALDAGVLTFRSVHPRYSYVALDGAGMVCRAAQCNPISQHATTGLFWFARAADFVSGAQNIIRKNVEHEGQYYIAPVLNELILQGLRVGRQGIEARTYRPLKTAKQMAVFENAHHLHAVPA